MIPNTPIERAIVELNGLINSILEKRKKELEKTINLLDGLENKNSLSCGWVHRRKYELSLDN